jgi:small subunit ribosomal protein S10|tara:strand:+ start:310 stop:720 length:411 start_codon:yes stop_codon:yes gene_type:complete
MMTFSLLHISFVFADLCSFSLSRLRQQQFTAAAPVAASKIRIRLKSFETTHMQAACDKIIEAATATEARIKGPIPLPTKRRIYCVLRSPHVNKDSREHFETRTHNRVIDVYEPTAQTIDALMGLELPAGVDIRVKL